MGISANKRCASSNSYNGRCKATISNPIEEDSFSRQVPDIVDAFVVVLNNRLMQCAFMTMTSITKREIQ